MVLPSFAFDGKTAFMTRFLNKKSIHTVMDVVSSFYKYVKIENPAEVQKQQIDLCNSLNLKGRILLGEEGINGCVAGTKENVEAYKAEFVKNALFNDVIFKDTLSEKQAYRKLFVRIREEIVNSGLNVDLRNTAEFVTPEQLKEMLDANEDLVLVDMRNDYESSIGKFRNAVQMPIRNFRDLPDAVDVLKEFKDKKIVTYCTGGIRCEKASAFLKENGFNDVQQLKGGILDYGNKFPDTYWEGKCFVFDDRLAISFNTKKEDLTKCKWCDSDGNYVNCHNIACDKLFLCCEECALLHKASCSNECEKAPKRRLKAVMVLN